MSARPGHGGALAKGWRPAFAGLVLIGVLGLFLFPVFWLALTALRPESEVFYVHRGTQFTLANFLKAWRRRLDAMYTGLKGGWRSIVAHSGLKVKQIGSTQRDQEFGQMRTRTREDILAATGAQPGIPPACTISA